MNRIFRLTGAALLTLGMSSFALTPAGAAEYIGTVEPSDILKMLQDNGYEDAYVADTDYEDLPILNFTLADSKAVIYFYECGKTGKACEYLQLYVGWSMDNRPSYKVINDFNAAERFSQAYIDNEDDPVIEQWVTLEGGISDVNFINTVATFGLTVDKFEDTIGWQN
ncbi:MAG: YbjN domain-containing protein [Parvibaculaceae bacterium]